MKTTLEKGLNIIKGEFTINTETNGQKIKAILDKINSLVEKKVPKVIIPVAYGFNSIIAHIENDDEEIFILTVPMNKNGIGIESKKTLLKVAKHLRRTDTDKIIVFVIDVVEDNYPQDYAEEIVEAYGKECIVIDK